MRRVLQHRQVEADIGPALGRHDRLDRQALQVVVVLQREGQVERELAARHAALAVGEVAREHRLLRRELLVELLAEGVVHHDEEHRAAAQRAIVVGQDLARPFGIEDVLPALGLVARLHQVAVDHQAVADDLAGDADVVGLVGRHDVLDVGHGRRAAGSCRRGSSARWSCCRCDGCRPGSGRPTARPAPARALRWRAPPAFRRAMPYFCSKDLMTALWNTEPIEAV